MIVGPLPGPRAIRSWPLGRRLAVWVGLLLLAACGFAVAFVLGWTAPPRGAEVTKRAEALQRWYGAELARAREVARVALERGLDHRGDRDSLPGRLEGVGQLDAESHYLSWRGIPPEPEPLLFSGNAPVWEVRVDGVHTRLLARIDPRAEEREALAAFILDSRLPEYSFARLVPARLLRGIQIDVEFPGADAWTDQDTERKDAGPEPDGERRFVLRAPDGTPLGRVELRVADRASAAERERRRALAWLVVLAIGSALVLFRWPEASHGAAGLVRALGAIVVARGALALVQAPALLLPREIGTASVFGASGALGMASSPADLLLSALGAWAASIALRAFLSMPALGLGRAARSGIAAAGGLAGVAAASWMLLQIARHSRLSLLGPAGPWTDGVRLILASGVALTALGAAELLAQSALLARPGPRSSRRRASRVAVAAVLSALLLGGGLLSQRLEQGLALERLRSEFAPLVLEQHARRSVALTAAIRRIAQQLESADALPPPGRQADVAAYELWVGSELFFEGYESSIALYDAQGEPLCHFGFGLPSLDETIAPEPSDERTWEEPFESVASVRKRLIHAQLPVTRDGRRVGTVVGHVVDDPDNLPFLPAVRPFLAALGPATQNASTGLPTGGPDYVLYDAPGTVLLSTLAQPPAMADALVQSFEHDFAVDLRAGEERVVGLAEQDDAHRLHALLLPAPGAIRRAAAAVRWMLVGLAWLALAELGPRLASLRFVRTLGRTLRGSFYRKLLTALLVASIVPLVGLALLLRGTIEQRGRESLEDTATRYASAAQRVLDDYAATLIESDVDYVHLLNDDVVDWLRNVVGQEILVYENGLLQATSKRELFTSGLLPPRLVGEVHRRLGREGLPVLVVDSALGPTRLPVAYAPVQGADPLRELVVAVPVIAGREELARATARVGDMILLSTVLLAGLLAFVAAAVARNVAQPVRELVGATGRIAAGHYDTRLAARTRDEVAELVAGFNSMAGSLASQRADLERRREYMERLLQHATTGVVSIDARGTVVTMNPAARGLLSTAAARVGVGADLASSLARSPELQPLGAALEAPLGYPGEPVDVDLDRGGQPRRMRIVRVELPDPAGGSVGRLILLDDVTDLMRSNQLAAWAEMARAIAHEIKNPLTPIQLSTEHLRRLLRDRGVLPDPDLEACLDTVIKQVRTLYDIAGEFSAYARLPTLEPRPADAVAFMRTVVGPYRAAPPQGIEIEERYADAGQAAIDERVLGRAVVNLLENALQAMPDGGRIEISVDPDPERNEVVLGVADSGVGLAPEARRRLFEPYFSTKSSGTGLGLAIVRRAVEAHHGRIEFESGDGRGTTFRIRLPRVA